MNGERRRGTGLRSASYVNLHSRFTPALDVPLLDQLIRHLEARAPEGMTALRFSISKSTSKVLGVEATYYSRELDGSAYDSPRHLSQNPHASVVVHVVPTSVGASIGGFAGDASPATRLLAQVAETVIAHPNVVNASDILSMTDNTVYVEGSLLDRFFLGEVALRPVSSNVVGIIIEKQPQRFVDQVRYSIDAAHATCGIPIAGYAVTSQKIGARVRRFGSGAYTGVIDHPGVLLDAAERLVTKGAKAIAVTAEILDLPDLSRYVRGKGPNPHGGLEALVSHTVSRRFNLPAAHAPMWGEASRENPTFGEYDPREAAELVTKTAIGCVLQGLHKAPQPVQWSQSRPGDLLVSDVVALVVPYRSIGNIPALSCEKIGIPILGVRENVTLQRVDPVHLNMRQYYLVENYLEAAGFVAALRSGISLLSLHRPVRNITAI